MNKANLHRSRKTAAFFRSLTRFELKAQNSPPWVDKPYGMARNGSIGVSLLLPEATLRLFYRKNSEPH
ncbi:hypothetical protein KL939_004498 [Ogataea angusta]|nr:hypothetical protein KL939_004498 [Ogataea angusta]